MNKDIRINPGGIFFATVLAGILLLAGNAAMGATTPVLNTSVNVEDNAENYIITVTTPEKDAPPLDLKLEGQTLHLTSSKKEGGARYDQNIYLPDADMNGKIDSKKEKNHVILTVPKLAPGSTPAPSPAALPTAPAPAATAAPSLSAMQVAPRSILPPNGNDPANQAMAQMLAMQKQMAQMASQMMQGFDDPNDPSDPDDQAFFTKGIGALLDGHMGAAQGITMEEKADRYVVAIPIPREHVKDISVSVQGDRMLHISSKNQSSNQTMGIQNYQSTSSTQMLSLPGPVNGQKMTSGYKDGSLYVSIPKA